MGLSHSPKIVTDGLVFAMDSGNNKSYKGPAIQNLLPVNNTINYSATGLSFTGSTETVYIPSVGTVTSRVNTGYNDYPAVSTGCCPSLYSYFLGGSLRITVAASTLYTYSILYKTTSGYTHPNFMYRYEFDSAGTYLTEAGVFSTTNRIDLGDGWYWAWGTFTTQPTAATISAYSFYYKYGTQIDKFYVAKVLMAQGNYTGLHPRYWPDVNTTRSNTNVLYDLTNRNTITANSLTYNSDGTFSFGGTNFCSTTGVSPSNQITVDMFVKVSSDPGGYKGFIGANDGTNNDYTGGFNIDLGPEASTSVDSIRIEGAGITWQNYLTTPVSFNQWFHLCAVISTSSVTLYINGVQNTSSARTSNSILATNFLTVGARPVTGTTQAPSYAFTGSIATTKIYNRALTPAEVSQNFNSLRGRFGV